MLQAVIFDLDGTVLDNEGVWEEVFRKVANSHALEYGNKWIHEPGIGIEPNWRKLISDEKKVRELSFQTWKMYWDQQNGQLNVRDGLVELVEEIKDRGWQTALATGSNWNIVENELEQLSLYLAFDVTTTGEEVLTQKPDPEIYQLTAQKMGLDPQECVVVEDSLAGVQAAVDAGMVVVGIVSSYATREELKKAGAKVQVDNLDVGMIEFLAHGDTQTIETGQAD